MEQGGLPGHLFNEVFMNPDLVSEISKNFDFLSAIEREKFLGMISTLSGVASLSEDKKDEFLGSLLQSRATYFESLYSSGVLAEDNPIELDNYIFTYSFSIIYPKSESMDINKEKFHKALGKMVKMDNFRHIQTILPKNWLIWNLDGIAGKIYDINECKIILIYCSDRENICIKEYYMDYETNDYTIPISEIYYKNGVLHRDNGPAKIEYRGVEHTYHASYYQNGKLHREDGPAEIGYKDGHIVSKIWYKKGVKLTRKK